MIKSTKTSLAKSSFALLSSSFLFFGFIGSAYAAPLTNVSNTQSRVRVSQNSSHTIRFTTPTGTNIAGQTIILTFPAGYNFSSKTIGTLTFTHGASTGLEATESLLAAATATAWGAVFSGTNNVTLTLTAPTDGIGTAVLAPNDRIIISYDSTNSINPASPGSYQIGITGTFTDTGTTTIPIVLDDVVSVTALVAQTVSFAISATTTNFGTLNTGSAKFASSTNAAGDTIETIAHTLAVATNAPSGYTITASGTTLTSIQVPANRIQEIGATPASSTPGTPQFGIRATRAGGVNGTIAAPYVQTTSYGYNATSSPQTFASGSSATLTETYSLRYVSVAELPEAKV